MVVSHTRPRTGPARVAIGIDIGSTTVKACVCDPDTLEILWSDYQRHETRQPEVVAMDFMVRIGDGLPRRQADVRIFMHRLGLGPAGRDRWAPPSCRR